MSGCVGFYRREIILHSPKGEKETEIQPVSLHNTTQREIQMISLIIMSYL